METFSINYDENGWNLLVSRRLKSINVALILFSYSIHASNWITRTLHNRSISISNKVKWWLGRITIALYVLCFIDWDENALNSFRVAISLSRNHVHSQWRINLAKWWKSAKRQQQNSWIVSIFKTFESLDHQSMNIFLNGEDFPTIKLWSFNIVERSQQSSSVVMSLFYFVSCFWGVNEVQDTHNVDSRSTLREVYSFNQKQSGEKNSMFFCDGGCTSVGMLNTFCVVYFTMDEHRSLVLVSLSIFHSLIQPRVKNSSIKAFYSWTMLNLFRVGLACDIESLVLMLLVKPRST